MNAATYFSETAEEMHAGASDFEAMMELFAELNREDAREAMEEARCNDGVEPLFI